MIFQLITLSLFLLQILASPVLKLHRRHDLEELYDVNKDPESGLVTATNLSNILLYSYEAPAQGAPVYPAITDLETGYQIESIEPLSTKRGLFGSSYVQRKVSGQGLWDQAWLPASGCYFTGLSTIPIHITQSWSQTTSGSFSPQFDISLAQSFSVQLGVTVESSFTLSGSWDVTIPGNSVGQTFTQKKMLWQDQQTQNCTKSIFGGDPSCGPWSGLIHGDLPSNQSYNLGMSYGVNDTSC